ncbi:CASP C terminal [Fragilaria crotonensis]|nr:CASP C terminal [Fragilaria crotonensis]
MMMRSSSLSAPAAAELQDAALLQSLQIASQAWVAFDWDGKMAQLEKASAVTREQKDLSLAARKLLAETTKTFKKSVKSMEQASASLKSKAPDADNLAVKAMDSLAKDCRQTIKSYQEEIDNLTRRCKASENAFLSVHTSIMEVPDPVALMSAAMDQIRNQQGQIAQLLRTVEHVNREMNNMEANTPTPSAPSMSRDDREELLQLRREVAEYEVEFRGLKNQDITIRKLEAKIAELEEKAQESLAQELEKAHAELAETEGRRAAEALEREAAMERRVQTLELQLKAERAGREATQTHLLEADEGAGEREAAWEAQRRILVDDAERLRETLHESNRERDELRLKVAATQGGSGGKSAPPSGALAVADILLERKAYEAEVSELSHTANALREELRLKEEASQDERRTLQASIDRLERERSTLVAQLGSLQTQLSAAPSQKYVDSIQRELRILKRLEYNAEDGERDPEFTGDGDEQDFEAVLVSKLKRVESDLVRNEISKITASAAKTGEGAVVLQEILEPGSPRLMTPASYSASEKANDDHSVATIVMAQRDRLRVRCDTLEAERDSFKRELQAQVQASESLKIDNTKLYEKVRYLQTYQTRLGGPDRDLDLEALEQRYEASVDPFRQFNRTERQRKMKEMSPMERIVFVVAKTALGTKEMRTALFVYVCAMHLLVFFTTYSGSHGECDDSHHEMLAHLAPDQHEKIAAAMSGA